MSVFTKAKGIIYILLNVKTMTISILNLNLAYKIQFTVANI